MDQEKVLTYFLDIQVALYTISSFTAQPMKQQVNDDWSVSSVPAGASHPLSLAPAWLKRPASVAWGFGGKLAVLTNSRQQDASGRWHETGRITIRKVRSIFYSKLTDERLGFPRLGWGLSPVGECC